MARNHGRILSAAWAPGSDLRTLDRAHQGMYFFLLSQPNLNHAGLLPLTLRKWAACAAGDTPASVEAALRHLAERRYVVIDWDTEELLVRTLVRNDGIWKQPKVMLAMVAAAGEIESLTLRRALLNELDRLPLHELSAEPGLRGGPSVREQVADCVEAVRALVGEPEEDAFAEPSEPVSDTHTDTLPDTPGEGYREPSTRAHARIPAPAPAPALFPSPADAADDEHPPKTTPGKPDPLEGFDEFWHHFPKKVGKDAAKRAYAKALKAGAKPREIADGAMTYAMDCRLVEDPHFIKHPSGWLNDGRWADSPASPSARERPPEMAWCGQCNKYGRTVETPDHQLIPCPECSPDRRPR